MFRPLRNVNIQYRGLPVCKLIRCQLSNYWQTSVCMWARESPVLFTDQRSIQPIFTIIYSCTELAPIIPSKKKKKAYEPCQQGAMAFPLQPNDTHNCEMTYASKAVIKRKPFPIEGYWHEAHSARKFIGWRWGMGKGNEQGVLEADLINVVDRKGECVQHSSRA